MIELVTNSRMSAYRTCPKLHHITYVQGYRLVQRSRPLDWGDLMHKLLEAWWRWYLSGGADSALAAAMATLSTLKADEWDRIRAKVMMAAYDLQWSGHDYKVLAVEQQFSYPSGRGYNLAGKIDGIIQHGDRVLILEHKNTSADFGPADPYWLKLRMEPQIGQYWRGAQSMGHQPWGCLWDVLRRPDIKPYQKTADIKYRLDGQPRANQRLQDETPEEFEKRLIEVISADPTKWFARREVVRLPDELAAFDRDTEHWAERCVVDSNEFAQPARSYQCWQYNRPCDMFGVCTGTGSLTDERLFRKVYNVHPELESA